MDDDRKQNILMPALIISGFVFVFAGCAFSAWCHMQVELAKLKTAISREE